MDVVLLATTVLHRGRLDETPYQEHPFPSYAETVLAADELAEMADRTRDASWDHTDGRLSNNRYLRSVLHTDDRSVFEHASATFWITGISRAASHQLIGHRALSYSEVPQLFAEDSGCAVPDGIDEESMEWIGEHFEDALDAYANLVDIGKNSGLSAREAREVARAVLPNCTETAVLVTGNMRTWREVVARWNVTDADPEMRSLADELLRQLSHIAPNTFQDLTRAFKRLYANEPSDEPQSSVALRVV